MAQSDSNDEKTENATPYRREEFRQQGTVALSRELVSVALFIAVGTAINLSSHHLFSEFNLVSQKLFHFFPVTDFGKAQFLELMSYILSSWAWMVSPILLITLLCGLAVCALQVGFYVTWEPLSPKWERLDPIGGLQRIFSKNGIVEALKAIFKMAIAGVILWSFFKNHASEFGNLLEKSVSEILFLSLSGAGKLFTYLVLSFAVLAVLDYIFQRYQLEQQMRMTKRETKEEFKLREGDPLIKARIKNIQRRIASRRMMESVPEATVVITNPTHLAIALQYLPEMSAPKVVAKGAGNIAEKIREIARANRVPIVENKPLARTMYKTLQIGQVIPKELYKAVAEVLSYIYKLRGIKPKIA